MWKKFLSAASVLFLLLVGYWIYRYMFVPQGYGVMPERSFRYCYIIQTTDPYAFYKAGDVVIARQKHSADQEFNLHLADEVHPLIVLKDREWQTPQSPRTDGFLPPIPLGKFRILDADSIRKLEIPHGKLKHSSMPKLRERPMSERLRRGQVVGDPPHAIYLDLSVGPEYIHLCLETRDRRYGLREENYIYWVTDDHGVKARLGEVRKVLSED